MALFVAGNMFGWQILRGNLSTSRLFDLLPLADPFAVLQILAVGKIVSLRALLGALVIAIFFAVVGGRAFCSWVCPVNVVTDFANWLRKEVRLDTAPAKGMERRVRYWILGMSLVISALTGVAAFEWISPVSMLHRGIIFGMGIGWMTVLGIFLFDLLIVKNGFCGHLCPLGGFYSLIGRTSMVKIRHDKKRCTLCGKCVEICPEAQVLPMVGKESGIVFSGECTNCGRCIEVCDEDAMKFGLRHVYGKQ
jgi:ferredoxin-type protein NapH